MLKQSVSQDCLFKGLHFKISILDNNYNINLYYTDNKLSDVFYLDEQATCEDICIAICNYLGIGTLAFYLFSLFVPSKQIWIPPCLKMIDYINKFDIYFRLRFLPAQLTTVIEDPNAFDYLFFQTRHDFINSNIPNINALKISDCLGLAVTDILQMREGSARNNVNFRSYIPINTANPMHNRLKLWISGNKAVKEALYNQEHYLKEHDKLFYQEKYIETLLKMPDYFIEKYYINLSSPNDKNGQKGFIYIDIKNDKRIVFRPSDPKLESSFLCNIKDLCFITLKSSLSIEISRKNGIPNYLDFEDRDLLYSFLSLVDGYYRLSEKFNFNLCTKCFSPLILKLKKMNIHGPVNDDFVISKLNDKAKNKPGTFMIRQSSKFDTYILDICLDSKCPPKSLYIVNELHFEHSNNLQSDLLERQMVSLSNPNKENKTSPKYIDIYGHTNIWHLENSKVTFRSLRTLLDYYSNCSEIKFRQCLPPSDYEHSNLLICHKNLNNVLQNQKSKAFDVRCILLQDLTFPISLETFISNGAFVNSLVPNVFWEKDKVTRIMVSVKLISGTKIHKSINKVSYGWQSRQEDLQSSISPSEFNKRTLKMINSYAFLNDPTIVKTFGICLDPIMIITEPLPSGSLDQFLRFKGDSIKITELLEACSNLSKALWYLEECELAHGNLRCSNIYVHSYAPNKLSVKLSDPITTHDQSVNVPLDMVENDAAIVSQNHYFQSQRLPWLAPEHYNVTNYQNFRPTLMSDVWAYGTTVWEIFSYGKNIPWDNMKVGILKEKILNGLRLSKPTNCPTEFYCLINECWVKNRRERKKIQELVRDVHQIYHHALNLQDRITLKKGFEQDTHNYELVEKFDATQHNKFPDLRRALPATPKNDFWDSALPSDNSYYKSKDISSIGHKCDNFLSSDDNKVKLRANKYTTANLPSRHSYDGSSLKSPCAPHFASRHSETDLFRKTSYYDNKLSYEDKYSNSSIDRLISKFLLKATNQISRKSSTDSEKTLLKRPIPPSAPGVSNLPNENDSSSLDASYAKHSNNISIVNQTKPNGEQLMTWANTKLNLLKRKINKLKGKKYGKGGKATDVFPLSALPQVPHNSTMSEVNRGNDLHHKTYHFPNSAYTQNDAKHEYVLSKYGNMMNNGSFSIDEQEITYLSKLGEGNFGEVWLALWDSPNSVHEERVAVKKLKRNENALEMADFENEIEILKNLAHPNIVQVKGICQTHYKQLVIEYLSNGSLEHFLKTYPDHLSTRKRLKFAIDISEGMEYLTLKGIVHRDLAARNILITNDMNSVKISDFGLSKIMERRRGEPHGDVYERYMSATGCDYEGYYAARTPRKLPICWYAPETIDPSCTGKRFNQRTDVWSFGVTLWELFCSASPFNAPQQDPVSTTLKAIMNQSIAKNPEIPNNLDAFLNILTPESFVTKLHELLAVVNWRLPMHSNCPNQLYHLLVEKCWAKEQSSRYTFKGLKKDLVHLHQTYISDS